MTTLPAEPIGSNDLVGISVYDSPELTRTVRVDPNGDIRLPLLRKHIKAAGLYPEDLEKAITSALIDEKVLVDPVVTVSITEYRSRPINVVGAVRSPTTFQAVGEVTLLNAIAQAGGLAENAGHEILVSRQQPTADGGSTTVTQRIPVRDLLNTVDPSLNITLHSLDIIRVPDAGQFYVAGNVKSPGMFPLRNGADSSILRAMALSGGLAPYSQHVAYIYRTGPEGTGKTLIPVDVHKILTRKASDVPIVANDILYVPDAAVRKATLTALGRMAEFGLTVGTSLLYIYH